MYVKFFKPLFDFIVALIVLLILSPFLLLVAILIPLDSKGPIFYTQDRLGMFGNIIKIFKFRSMTHDENRKPGAQGELTKDNQANVTRIGKFIRRYKIDEIPQLLNVLKGDLSLVGPRPSLPEQKDQLDEYGKKRLLVKPGCTGLAQVNGSIYRPWEERWKYDAYYVENLSFWMDMKILFKTIFVILLGEERFARSYEEFLESQGKKD